MNTKVSFGKLLLASILGTVVGLGFFFLITLGILSALTSTPVFKVKKNSVLKVELKGSITERETADPFSIDFLLSGGEKSLGLNTILRAIRAAKGDENISALLLYCDVASIGDAMANEIREAILDFKKSGKPVYAYAESYTEETYFIATAADKIFLYPEGALEWNGLGHVGVFYRGLFDKLGIEPIELRIGEYKSAVENYVYKKYTEANRRQLETLFRDLWSHFVFAIHQTRNVPTDSLEQWASRYIFFLPEEAKAKRLVDDLLYYDQVEKALKEALKVAEEEKLAFVTLKQYRKTKAYKDADKRGEGKIAVIYAVGPIGGGKGSDTEIGSETLSEWIRKAREDEKVKAVVLRVNSPGGSALASDVIAREIALTKEKKPIIASYGDVAASGGYYISVLCDKIVANPNSITGSIGVIGILFNVQPFLTKKLDITVDRIFTHPSADLGTILRGPQPYEKERLLYTLRDIYGDFVHKVMEGRGFKDSIAVDTIGQGRVWSGSRALSIGLVDTLGSLSTAIQLAAQAAGLGDAYTVVEYPTQKDISEKLMEALGMGDEGDQVTLNLPGWTGEIQKLLRVLNDPKHAYFLWCDYPIGVE